MLDISARQAALLPLASYKTRRACRYAQKGTEMKFTYGHGDRPLDGYTIHSPLGHGGFGEVYHAVSDAGKHVALKLVQRSLDVELRGVGHCLNLKHTNLVTVYDVRSNAEAEQWVVMEFVSGRSLAAEIDAHPAGLPRLNVIRWFEGICAGVEHLHQNGIVHRDLKPSNVFDDDGIVKVGDYGLSKFITASRRSGHTQSIGTVHYMAPEIGSGRYGREVDVYALGIMLYEMLIGHVPFNGETPAEVLMKHLTAEPPMAQIPAPFRAVVTRMLAKDPEERYGSPMAVVADLKARLADAALTETSAGVEAQPGVKPRIEPTTDAGRLLEAGLATKSVVMQPAVPPGFAMPREGEWMARDGWRAADAAFDTPSRARSDTPVSPHGWYDSTRRRAWRDATAKALRKHPALLPFSLFLVFAAVMTFVGLMAATNNVVLGHTPYAEVAFTFGSISVGALACAALSIWLFVWRNLSPGSNTSNAFPMPLKGPQPPAAAIGQLASTPTEPSTKHGYFDRVCASLRAIRTSNSDAMIGGVCGGLGEHTPLPSWAWRVLFACLIGFAGTGFLLYLVLWFSLPGPESERDDGESAELLPSTYRPSPAPIADAERLKPCCPPSAVPAGTFPTSPTKSPQNGVNLVRARSSFPSLFFLLVLSTGLGTLCFGLAQNGVFSLAIRPMANQWGVACGATVFGLLGALWLAVAFPGAWWRLLVPLAIGGGLGGIIYLLAETGTLFPGPGQSSLGIGLAVGTIFAGLFGILMFPRYCERLLPRLLLFFAAIGACEATGWFVHESLFQYDAGARWKISIASLRSLIDTEMDELKRMKTAKGLVRLARERALGQAEQQHLVSELLRSQADAEHQLEVLESLAHNPVLDGEVARIVVKWVDEISSNEASIHPTRFRELKKHLCQHPHVNSGESNSEIAEERR